MEKAVHSSTTSGPAIPGEATKTGTSIIDTAASAVQSFAPVNQIHQHLCAYVNPIFINSTFSSCIICASPFSVCKLREIYDCVYMFFLSCLCSELPWI
ncbi:unnamed protein product [Microthlaspi erraticum]|uniref:Uncharacterized protein n=1 Tax=Microthlaspi erraticum TaxID=1685480 RepID=A0A6D2K961_9BRAS|nr:unnamed protein product [Microthlaspi erraticum]